MQSLQSLIAKHQGKVIDRWSSYITKYESLFAHKQNDNVKFCEIGILNGGSLELWNAYFPNAEIILGCDINPDIQKLTYQSPKIKTICGDINGDDTIKAFDKLTDKWDIIIDDGSHRSGDIIKAFANYFPRLKDDGLYVIEDLHCSYRSEFQGGLYNKFGAIEFLKKLADTINFEHWEISINRTDYLDNIFNEYGCTINEDLFSQIFSVEFANSLCIIRKCKPDGNILGKRICVGTEELVDKGRTLNHGKFLVPLSIIYNEDNSIDETTRTMEQKILRLQNDNDLLRRTITNSLPEDELAPKFFRLQGYFRDLEAKHKELTEKYNALLEKNSH